MKEDIFDSDVELTYNEKCLHDVIERMDVPFNENCDTGIYEWVCKKCGLKFSPKILSKPHKPKKIK